MPHKMRGKKWIKTIRIQSIYEAQNSETVTHVIQETSTIQNKTIKNDFKHDLLENHKNDINASFRFKFQMSAIK